MTKLFTQIGDEVRELTAEEVAEYQADAARLEKELADKAAELEAKAVARIALLERLGITEDEAILLLTPVKVDEPQA